MTGQYYDRAREYGRTATGTFTSNDPDGYLAGSTNLRSYVGNSPQNATDPTGDFQVPAPKGPITIQMLVTPEEWKELTEESYEAFMSQYYQHVIFMNLPLVNPGLVLTPASTYANFFSANMPKTTLPVAPVAENHVKLLLGLELR